MEPHAQSGTSYIYPGFKIVVPAVDMFEVTLQLLDEILQP